MMVLNLVLLLFNLGLATSLTHNSAIGWHIQDAHLRERRAAIESPVKLIAEPLCSKISQLCSDLSPDADDLFTLDCIYSLKPVTIESIDDQCQHIIWTHTMALMNDNSVKRVTKTACEDDLKTMDCSVTNDVGHFLSCLVYHVPNINGLACRDLVQKLELVAFSDYRLISSFIKSCTNEIGKLSCGRLSLNREMSQGKTIACLQNHINELPTDCKGEVLHLSELQAENIKLDRQLYLSCGTDIIRFCPDLHPESGLLFKCLMYHKTEHSMSKHCLNQLTRREKLIVQDYKISRGLAHACKDDIKAYHCRRGVSSNKEIRLAQILLCLEGVMKNNSRITPECEGEMIEHRKMLLQDYQLSPDLIHSCHDDIPKFCNNLDANGRTIHCLMEHAKPRKKKEQRVSVECQRALETLIKITDAGEDWRVDPVLRESCKPVVDVACKEVHGGGSRVMSCLMEQLGTDHMTEDCETALVQIQYFVARDFKLDSQLYRACKDDAIRKCHAKKGWTNDENSETDPERGPLVLPCLYRYAYHPDLNMQLKPVCLHEIKRVMRQRAISVDLQPEIEDACLDDLAMFCFEKTGKGEEMLCLQNNLDSLMHQCKAVVSNFTENEAGNIELNPVIMTVCKSTMERYCDSILKTGKDEGEMMECLIAHKNEPDVRAGMKCRAAIEHFQLLSLKNYHFTYKFKEACKPHVSRHCPMANTKYDIIACLSEVIRNETIKGSKHSIPKECRQQVKAQLYQQRENIDFDVRLKAACKEDIKEFCGKVEHGSGQVLECLQEQQGSLSKKCQHALFPIKRQELTDSSIDFALMNSCHDMLKQYCQDADPSHALECLKKHRNEVTFDSKCRLVVMHRMIQQNTDFRFNPALTAACNLDIYKFCTKTIEKALPNEELNGKVIECLKKQFRNAKLSRTCEDQMTIILRDQALNYKLNPLLATMCRAEISTICKVGDSEQDNAGEVEECLRMAFLKHKIVNKECMVEVAALIEEGHADIHVDPLLQRACSIDLLKYCGDIQPGAGRLIKCLQIILTDATRTLEEECKTKLTKRMDMFSNAALVAPSDVQELVDQVYRSPARKYFMFVFLSVVGLIFIFGLFCGRITRRAIILKNK